MHNTLADNRNASTSEEGETKEPLYHNNTSHNSEEKMASSTTSVRNRIAKIFLSQEFVQSFVHLHNNRSLDQ